jgi:hypothetical protein
MHGCIKWSLREPFQKNNHKTYGTNKFEKLKKKIICSQQNILGENLSKKFLSMSLKKQP